MKPARILVVEDENIVAKDLQLTLQQMGYDVPATARSGEHALELAAHHLPDLVLMDVHLDGEIDGIAAAALIIEKRPVPIIFLTGFLDDDTIARAKSTNPFGYLVKPFDERELRSSVEVALSRHRSEQTARASAERFASTLRSMADGVIATDLAGTITFMNPMAEALTGWAAQEAAGRSLGEVFKITLPSGETAAPLPPENDTDHEASSRSRPIMLSDRAGKLVPIEDNTAPLLDDDGSLAGLVIVFRPRLDGPALPEDADSSWAHLVGIVESIADPLFAVDARWKLTYANRKASDYFGKSRAELIGRTFWDELPRALQDRCHADFYGAMLHTEVRTFELHHEARGQWFDVHAYPFADGLLVLFRDITERKAAEEQRAKMEKLESLSLLARGFAHDFNNLLTVLIGNLSLAARRIPEAASYRGEIETARSATFQAQSLVHQLLTFAKGGAPVKQRVRLSELVGRILDDHPPKTNISYQRDFESRIPNAQLDPNQIRRLIANLIRNAEQAMPEGGTLTVRCRSEVSPDGDPDAAGSDTHVVLEVLDTGRGISSDDLEFIFEPFFSSRADENASGIGLTVCESIARAHDGAISVQSQPGRGTAVTVRLPAAQGAEPAAEAADEPAAQSAPQIRAQRVLLLEDEPLIQQLAVSNLRSHGFHVDIVADGTEAVARYRDALNNGGRYDLLILDLTIPNGMGGAKTLEHILKLDPEAVAIVSSGYSDDPVMARPAEYGFKAVLPKPYEPKDLTRIVRQTLTRAGRDE